MFNSGLEARATGRRRVISAPMNARSALRILRMNDVCRRAGFLTFHRIRRVITAMKWLLIAGFCFITGSQLLAQTSIIVSKGTAATTFGTVTATTKETQKAYFVYDISSATGRMIFVSAKNKTVIDTGAKFYGFSRPKSGTKFYQYFVTSSSSFTNNTNFNASQTYLKGMEANIFLTSPTTGAFTYPKSLAGAFTNINGAAIATTATIALVYDAKGTQTKNTAGQSALQASQNIRGEFISKGYTDISQ
jgi:hypothetical protein